jgi:hypothetical protein
MRETLLAEVPSKGLETAKAVYPLGEGKPTGWSSGPWGRR